MSSPRRVYLRHLNAALPEVGKFEMDVAKSLSTAGDRHAGCEAAVPRGDLTKENIDCMEMHASSPVPPTAYPTLLGDSILRNPSMACTYKIEIVR